MQEIWPLGQIGEDMVLEALGCGGGVGYFAAEVVSDCSGLPDKDVVTRLSSVARCVVEHAIASGWFHLLIAKGFKADCVALL